MTNDLVPTIPTTGSADGRLIYAIGDVHGRYDLLKALLARIAADVAQRAAGRRPVLVFCGDYIDRGPDAAAVLAAIGWLMQRDDYETHALIGNHEEQFLAWIDDPDGAREWLGFGGEATLRAYGVASPGLYASTAAQRAASRQLLDAMPAAHLRLIHALEDMVVIGDYAFVHAGVRPGVALAAQSADDLRWIREPFLSWTAPFEKVIVHGHSWTDARPVLRDNRIGIDTGAYETGVLTAIRIEDRALAILQAGAEAPATASPAGPDS